MFGSVCVHTIWGPAGAISGYLAHLGHPTGNFQLQGRKARSTEKDTTKVKLSLHFENKLKLGSLAVNLEILKCFHS